MKKTVLSIITLLTISAGVNAQNVNIPDANFKAAVVANPVINTNGDTEIQVSEANSYGGALNVSQQNISDMTGLEEFTNIFNLNCGQNPLTSVDVSSNVALTSLTVNFTSISTIDVSNLVNLTSFNCTDNALTNVDLTNNTSLTTIRVANNSLTDLNVKNGNNSNVTFFQAQNNPSLTCIEVDDASYSTSNWTNIDATTSFSIDCNATPCTVNIPDANFKANLVGNAAINTNGNTEIECSEASAFSGAINCQTANISDLTGIEAFANITHLDCYGNQLTSLNVSSNSALTFLSCWDNQISALDVSQNTNLETLDCATNLLSSLDVSQNTSLTTLYFGNNSISSIDVAQHTALTAFACDANLLTELNIATGNNSNFILFSAMNNPNLTCIQVDDAAWSTSNWTYIDASASFSEDCSGALSLEENGATELVEVYPNPTTGVVTFSSAKEISSIEIYSLTGQKVSVFNNTNTIDISSLPNGVYTARVIVGSSTPTIERLIKK